MEYFGKEFCGLLVWYPGMNTGIYQIGIDRSKVGKFIKIFEDEGLIVKFELK